jgi:hypothetical protein
MACENPCDCPTHKFDAVVAPSANDDNCDTSGNGTFCEGSYWYDTVAEKLYMNIDATCTNAQWKDFVSKETLTHFRGYVIPPQSVAPAVFTIDLDVTRDYNVNPADSWDAGTKTFTVGQSGIYVAHGDLLCQVNNNSPRWGEGNYIQLLLYKNGECSLYNLR